MIPKCQIPHKELISCEPNPVCVRACNCVSFSMCVFTECAFLTNITTIDKSTIIIKPFQTRMQIKGKHNLVSIHSSSVLRNQSKYAEVFQFGPKGFKKYNSKKGTHLSSKCRKISRFIWFTSLSLIFPLIGLFKSDHTAPV